MIEGVAPVARTEAVALSVAASLASRQGTFRRQRRLRWLASLRDALGEDAPLDDEFSDEEADEDMLARTRERIAAAVCTIEQMRGCAEEAEAAHPDRKPGLFMTATELGHRIGAAGEKSLRMQARLNAATVLHLVGGFAPPAVNGV